MLRQFRPAAVLAATLACAGCGIKGPLVLPPATPPAATAPAPAKPPAATPGATESAPAERKQ